MIEHLKDPLRLPARVVVFDFDGTVGMVRAGWMPLMLDMMMETLGALGSDPGAMRAEAEAYVARFTGKDTVHQMEPYVEHVRRLGGEPKTAAEYKAAFMIRLEKLRAERLTAVQEGRAPADALLVRGIREFLESLQGRGLDIYLASGSAHDEILRESKLLGIEQYFKGIYGSSPESLTKRELLERIVASGTDSRAIVMFGDGRVEIEEAKRVGGAAVGVASDEPECLDVDLKKRAWLAEAGADYIVPNYLEDGLLELTLL